MNPNKSTANDPDVIAFAKAMIERESGGNASAKGKSAEYGLAQWQEPTWNAEAKKYLGYVPKWGSAEMTPEVQKAVLASKIADRKNQGYNPAQIAAEHNSGSKDGWENKIGVNKYGVEYNVPAYVKAVTDTYQRNKGSQVAQGNYGTPQPSGAVPMALAQAEGGTPAAPVTKEPEKKQGLISRIFKGITAPVVGIASRPLELGAMALGASAEDIDKFTSEKLPYYKEALAVPRSGKDVVKDVGRAAQTASLGMPVARVAQAARAGLVSGFGAGLEQGGTAGEVLQKGAVGTALGAAGGVVGKALEAFPKWLTGQAFDGIRPETAAKILNEKTIGTSKSLFRQSQKEVSKLNAEVHKHLSDPKILELVPTEGAVRSDALLETLKEFPEYAGKQGLDRVVGKIRSLIPATNSMGLDRTQVLSALDKVIRGEANLVERNLLRSALDRASQGGYAKLAKSLNPNAGHDFAMTFANKLRDEVQTLAPETQPLFAQMSKELEFMKILDKAAKKGGKGLIRYRDLIPFITGQTLGGPLGGLGTLAAARALENPAVQFGIAKTGQKAAKAVSPLSKRAGLLPSIIQDRTNN